MHNFSARPFLTLLALLLGMAFQPAPALSAPQVDSMAGGSDNLQRLVWTNSDGSMAYWRTTATTPTGVNLFGPYPGYSPLMAATGGNNVPRILWNKTDGSMWLWNLTESSASATTENYGPYPGWTAASVAVGGNNIPRIMWTNTSGAMSLWTNADVSSAGPSFGPYPGWTASFLAVGPNNIPRVLWVNTSGQISLWYNADTGTAANNYGPYTGYSPISLIVDSTNAPRILWNHPSDNTISLWNIAPNSNYTYQNYPDPVGFTPKCLSAGSAGSISILWTKTDGTVQIEVINSSGAVQSQTTYPAAFSVSLAPSSVVGGASSIGTVTLNAPALAGGTTVTLSSSSPSATVPATVTVLTGATSANFPVSTLNPAAAVGVTLSATAGGTTQTTTLNITPAPDFSLSPNPASVSVSQGAGVSANITVNPLYGFGGSVSLSAPNLPSYVSASFSPVTTNGTSTVTFSAGPNAVAGSYPVIITGTSGTLTHSISLTLAVQFTPSIVSSIIVSPNLVTLTTYQQQLFTVKAYDQLGRICSPIPSLGWTVTGNNSITPTGNPGILTAGRYAGTYTVTAANRNGLAQTITGSANFTVSSLNAATLTGISISPATASVPIGGTQQFTALGTYSDGSTADVTSQVTWGVNGGYGISAGGLFSADSAPGGPYTVTASLNGFNSTATVTVVSSSVLSNIVVTPNPVDIMPNGTQQFTATAYDQNGNPLSPQPTFTWNCTSGLISQSGLYTAGPNPGPVTITATSGSMSGSAGVTITTSVGSGDGTPTGADAYFNVSGGHIDITQGSGGTITSGSTTFSVSPSNGFIGTVIPSLTGLPPGVTATFNPPLLPINGPSGVSGTVTFNVNNSVLPGFYPLMLKVSSGSIADSDSLDLNIIPAPNPAANFGLSLDSDVVEMSQNTKQIVNLTLNTYPGFSANVSLSLADDPNHNILTYAVSIPFQPSVVSISNPTCTVSLQINSGIPEGAYHLMITGTGTSGTVLLPLTIYVFADDSNGSPVQQIVCNDTSTPAAPLATSLADTLRFDLTSSQGTLIPFAWQSRSDETNAINIMKDEQFSLNPNNIIGSPTADLIYVKSIFPNFDFPYCTVCRIEAYDKAGIAHWGTGTLVGYNHVLTAAHVVYGRNRIRVSPAFDGDYSKVYGSAVVKRYHTPAGYLVNLANNILFFDDYALLDLYKSGPNNSKGYRSSLGYRAGYVPMAADFHPPSDGNTFIAGYPQYPNPPNERCRLMYVGYVGNGDDGFVTTTDTTNTGVPGIVFDTIDSVAGDSGAGLRHPSNSANYPYSIYGLNVGGSPTCNYDTLISTQRIALLKFWMALDGDDVAY